MKTQKAAVDPSNVKCSAGDAVFGCLASLRLNAFKIIRIHGLRCLCLFVSSQCEELTRKAPMKVANAIAPGLIPTLTI